MAWIQLVFMTDAIGAERLSEALEALEASAVILQDAADEALFDIGQEQISLWNQTRLIGLFEDSVDPDRLIKQLKHTLPCLPPHECIPLKDQDWERAWMSRFKPMSFGDRIWVCPSWETPPDPAAINLILDPGMAFGTGTHETTALCLEWLASESHRVANKTVVDYGCGSGILAIAAARLNASRVFAVDIEQQALDSTAENARINAVTEKLHISGPDEFDQHRRVNKVQADLIIANILANPLVMLAPRFAEYTDENGTLVLSGLLKEQVETIIQACQRWFSFTAPIYKQNWALLEGRRKSQ